MSPKEVGPNFSFGSAVKQENNKTTRTRVKKEPLVKKDTVGPAQIVGKGSGVHDINDDEDEEEDELDLDLSWAKALDRPLSLQPSASGSLASSSSSSSSSTSPAKKAMVGWGGLGRMISNPSELRENLVGSHADHRGSKTTSTIPTQASGPTLVVTKTPLLLPTNEDPNKTRSSRKRKRSDSTPPPPVLASSQQNPRLNEEDDDDEIQPTQEEMEDMDLAEVGLLGLGSGSSSGDDDEEEGHGDKTSERRGKKSERVSGRSSRQAEVGGEEEQGQEEDEPVQIKVSTVSVRGVEGEPEASGSGSKRLSKRSASSKRRSSNRAGSSRNVDPSPDRNPTRIPLPNSPQPQAEVAVGPHSSPHPPTPQKKVSTPKAKVPTWATATPTRSPVGGTSFTPVSGGADDEAMEVDELESPVGTPVRRGRAGAAGAGGSMAGQPGTTPRTSIRRSSARKAGGGGGGVGSPKQGGSQGDGGGR